MHFVCNLRVLELAYSAKLLALDAAGEIWVALDLLFTTSQTGLVARYQYNTS